MRNVREAHNLKEEILCQMAGDDAGHSGDRRTLIGRLQEVCRGFQPSASA